MADKYNGAFTGAQIDEAIGKALNGTLMNAETYDPQGKATDIFKYVEEHAPSGVHIGPEPPTNGEAVWIDTDENVVKYLNPTTGEWETASAPTEGGGTTESIEHPGCFYRMVNGVQEWLNPPMELGVEYKTTERYLGKPVYVAAIDCGNLPNASYKMVAIPNSTTVDFVVRVNAVTSDKRTLPGASGFEENEGILCFANGPQVQFITRKDQSALTATAMVWYIKKTD